MEKKVPQSYNSFFLFSFFPAQIAIFLHDGTKKKTLPPLLADPILVLWVRLEKSK